MIAAGPIAVGVTPAEQLQRRPRLFAALEAALPVRFEARAPGELRGLDALLVLGPADDSSLPAGLPSLSLAVAERQAAGEAVSSMLAETALLDERLRGASLPDDRLGAALGEAIETTDDESATVLATSSGTPTWTRTGEAEHALLIPAELEPREALRERLCDRRSAALLSLLHFLRERTEEIRWQPPVARACLLFDDPNLHWPSYGFVKLAELSRARSRATATTSLSPRSRSTPGSPTRRPLRALKRERGRDLAAASTATTTTAASWAGQTSEAEAIALAAQALRRVEAFEPPHRGRGRAGDGAAARGSARRRRPRPCAAAASRRSR